MSNARADLPSTQLQRNNLSPVIENIKSVDGNNLKKNQNRANLISTEYFDNNKKYMELYSDGTVIYINRLTRKEDIGAKRSIDLKVLENAVEEFRDKKKVIKISELLNSTENI